MALLKLFRTDISSAIGNVHEPIIDRAIVGAAIEFCDRTRLWVDDLTDISDVTTDPFEFELTIPADRTLIGLQEVYFEDRIVHPENVINLKRTSVDWHVRKANRPTHYYHPTATKIRFWPGFADGVTGTVKLRGSFKPKRNVTELPEFLYDDYQDAMVNGALSRLHSMRGKSWYSLGDSKSCKRDFNMAVDSGRIRAKKNRTNSSIRLRVRGAA